MAATPIAVTEVVDGPMKRISPVFSVLLTVTRIAGTGSSERATPATTVGKSILTVSSADPPNPFLRAYTQGVLPSPVEQLNTAGGIPVANGKGEVPLVPVNRLMIP